MKKILTSVVLLTFCSMLTASEIAAIGAEDNSVRLLSSDNLGVVMELITPDFEIEADILKGVEYNRIKIPGWGITGEFGKPELPVISKTIALPYTAGVDYSVEILETEEIPDIDIYPLQEGKSDRPDAVETFMKDENFYRSDLFYPAERVSVSDPVIMRDLRLVNVAFSPFSYNPASRRLNIVKRMRLTLNFTSDNAVNPKLHRRAAVSSTFAPLYRSIVMNYEDVMTDEITQRGGYIFIVTNNTYANQIQPLVDWKKEKGFNVDVAVTSQIGTSKSSIYNYISDAYYNWEVPPEFVALVGDMNGSISIETDHYNCGWFDNAVTDHYYAKLEGSDYFPDVMVGRLSVRSPTELNIVINKIITYETSPLMTTNWFTRALMIADYSNVSCKLIKQYAKMECLRNGYTQVDTVWFGWSCPTTQVSNSVNNGVGIVNFRGYLGWGGWGTGNVYNLNNLNRNPIVFGCTCETGSFEITDCLSEAWLRAGSSTMAKGGMGCVGPSSWNTHTSWNNCIDQGFFWGVVHEKLEYWMESVIRGKLELWNNYPYNHGSGTTSNSVECYYHIYNLIGDPGLSVWTAYPEEFIVDIPGDIPLGSDYYPVQVENSQSSPVEGAYVNLWKGDEVFIGGFTDENGAINIPIDPLTGGEMKVCVSKQNFLPVRERVQVIEGQLFVGVNTTDIDDDNTPPSSGNGDGVLNPGESIEFDVMIENFGGENVSGLSGEIIIDNPLFSVTTSTVTFPDLSAGAAAWSQAPFVFTVSPQCPHGTNLEIEITITDDLSNEWTSMVMFEVESAELLTRHYDLPSGGTNGLLDPGETSQMIVNLGNIGTYASETLTGVISCESDEIEIIDNQGVFTPINPGAYGNNSSDPFEAHTPVETFPGSPVTIILELSGASGFSQPVEFVMDLGVPGSADPLVRDSYGYYCYDDSDAGYSAAPVYEWVEVSGLTSSLNLPDYGDEQDCSVTVPFPPDFTFTYYGQTFDRITVCSNGWAALGATYMCNFRNWPITAAQVAPACLAAYWDDLVLSSGGGSSGKVFAYFQEEAHRIIIEWNQVHNAENWALETFEIILYDPMYYPTPTGDGIVEFQYQTINNVATEHYSTVGIATPENGDGIQYTYANMYPPGAATLHNNMAIRFTTQGNEGWEPPIIRVNPSALIIEVPTGGSASNQLTISNIGVSSLIFNIEWSADGAVDMDGIPSMVVPGGMDNAGGPDIFGYTWADSDEPGGPEYNWVDITGIGTPITFVHNDSTTEEMPIGFDMTFYDQVFSDYIISANGWISFTSHANAWNNTTLPNPSAPSDLIAGFWDDLDPLQPGAEVLGWSNGEDSLVVSFLETPHWSSSATGTYTFQMILTADGGVTCQYQTLIGDYNQCTVGIQNSDGSDGLQAAYNQAYLHDNLAVRFYHPFLRVSPVSGSVPVGGEVDVDVIAYAYGLEQGSYPAQLSIESNDPATPLVEVPVIVNVGGGSPSPLIVTMIPENPPIVIPASGGSFNFTGGVINISGTVQQFDIWIMVTLPNGMSIGPILQRSNLSLPPGGNISRDLSQNVPGGAPIGEYYYYACVGFYPDSVIATDGFNFSKSATGDNASGVGDWSIFGWDEPIPELPLEFAFHGCRPNPFNPVTEVVFDLPLSSRVKIAIYDILGRRVAMLQDGIMPVGSHLIQWNAKDMASGVYFLRFQSGNYTATNKLLLLK